MTVRQRPSRLPRRRTVCEWCGLDQRYPQNLVRHQSRCERRPPEPVAEREIEFEPVPEAFIPPETSVYALTLWQPWATLIALGAKTIETRPRYTNIRGRVAIHAAASVNRYLFPRDTWVTIGEYAVCNSVEGFRLRLAHLPRSIDPEPVIMPLASVVATADITDCRAMTVVNMRTFPKEQLPYGHFEVGRFAYDLANIKPIDPPIPARGSQGWWRWTLPQELR